MSGVPSPERRPPSAFHIGVVIGISIGMFAGVAIVLLIGWLVG